MNEYREPDTTAPAKRALEEAIRGAAFGLLIGGAICLYFGFTWLVDAPGSASKEAVARWYAVDHVFLWALRIVGVVFFIAAGGAAMGQRWSALLATISESAFTLLMIAMAIDTMLEARADGAWDAMVIILGVLAIISMSAAWRSWRVYAAGSRATPMAPVD